MLRIQIADATQGTLIHSPQTRARRNRSHSHLVRFIPYNEDVARILIPSLDLNPFIQVMLVKHKFLSEQFDGQSLKRECPEDCERASRRTPPYKNIRANNETGRGEVAIFHHIAKEDV